MFQCCNVIVACCILHNIALDNQAEPVELAEPEEPEEPELPDAPIGFVQDRVARRQHIATTHFSCK